MNNTCKKCNQNTRTIIGNKEISKEVCICGIVERMQKYPLSDEEILSAEPWTLSENEVDRLNELLSIECKK